MNPRYLVHNENTLGYVYEEQPYALWPLARIIHPETGLGRAWQEGAIPFDQDRCREATVEDFERHRLSPVGYIVPIPPNATTANPQWGIF